MMTVPSMVPSPVSPLPIRLFPFLAWRHRVTVPNLRADLAAGLIGALVVLPQGVAYATLAGMPAAYGLYAAMLPVIVAALWGSSWHQISGPTNTVSLAVFATLAPLAVPGSDDYIRLALTLALLVGLVELAMGIARLGWLVDFISHTVIVGFTAGAGLLIVAAQLRTFFGVNAPAGGDFAHNVIQFARHAGEADPWTTATGLVTIAAALAARRRWTRIPYMAVGLVAGGLFGWAATRFAGARIAMVGALPGGVPPLSAPSLSFAEWRSLAPAALALTALALAQSVSVARAVAVRTGQRLDGNQEFVGQGLSNVVAAFTSGYLSSGSFNRVWVNVESGAKTPLAAVFSALFLFAIVVALAPLGAWLPLATMAGLLFVVAWGLVDVREMRRIARVTNGDAVVLGVTLAATLALPLEIAIFVGVIASLVVYLNRTTHPRLTRLAPDPSSSQRRFVPASAAAPPCPQLDVVRIDGSLFFGAVENVRDATASARAERPGVRHLLIVGTGVNFVDVAGAELIAQEARAIAADGGTLHLCDIKPGVLEVLDRAGALSAVGAAHVFETKEEAIRAIYAGLDCATCRACTVRVFTECAAVLPDGTPRDPPRPAFALHPNEGPSATLPRAEQQPPSRP
jgi:SulP family sulfate permease